MDSLNSIVNQRIQALRPRLMDTTRRNPLLNNAVTARAAAFVSVIDEKPQNLLDALLADKPMFLAPLPPLDEDDLPDEKTESFLTAFDNAQKLDEEYLKATSELDFELDERAFERQATLERELKDRIREQLELPPRPVGKQHTDLVNHAKIHGINPSKSLPLPDYAAGDDRHDDDEIQTLLLPASLQQKGRGIYRKQRTFEEERGLKVTYLVIGYLSWSMPDAYGDSDVQKSPLIILPIELDKRKSGQGEKYLIKSIDEPSLNPVLIQKLTSEARLDLKTITKLFEDADSLDVEQIFEATQALNPKRCKTWEVKREATIGVYPFQGIDLYEDLAPDNIDFSEFSVLQNIFVGSDSSGSEGLDWEDFDVDGKTAEQLVPHLVLDADSSQFTALSKVANGENVALEGPPGSGKSQTIVNAIANALHSGKKVLFVAQKMTALEVVHSRLQALGLEKFVLPMVGSKGDSESFYRALEKRVKDTNKAVPRELETLKRQFEQQRTALTTYIDLVQQNIAGTKLSIYEVMGLYAKAAEITATLPYTSKSLSLDFSKFSPAFDLEDLLACEAEIIRLAEALLVSQLDDQSPWSDAVLSTIDLNALSHFRSHALRAIEEYKSGLLSLSSEEQSFLANAIENNDLKAIESGYKKAQSWRQSSDSNWRKITETAEAAKPLLEVFAKAASELDELVKRSNQQGLHLKAGVEIQGELETYLAFLNMSGATSLNSKSINDLINDAENHLERLQALETDLETLKFSGIELSPKNLMSCKRAFSSLTSENLVKAAAQDNSIDEIINDIKSAQEILGDLYSELDEGQKVPTTNDLKAAFTTISSAGFFARFGGEYKSAVSKAKEWLGYTETSNVDRGMLTGSLQSSMKLRRKLDSLSFADQLGETHSTDRKWLKSLGTRLSEVSDDCQRMGLKRDQVSRFITSKPADSIAQFLDELDAVTNDWDFLKASADGAEKVMQFSAENKAALEQGHDFALEQRLVSTTALSSALNSCRKYQELSSTINAAQADLSLPDPGETHHKVREYLELCENLESMDPTLVNGCFIRENDDLHRQLGQQLPALTTIAECTETLGRGKGKPTNSWHLGDAIETLRSHLNDETNFQKLIQRQNTVTEAASLGMQAILVELESQRSLHKAPELVGPMLAESLRQRAETQYGPKILGFSGVSLDTARSKLQVVDKELIKLAPKAIHSECHQRARPPEGVGYGRKSEYTEMSLLHHELAKKRRTPPRKLLKRAQGALAELFPCWMMVPNSVAQHLPRSEFFDLVIIDEASQMTPETAISALMRAKNALISGDTNQLPPTNFFRGLNDEEDEDVDEDIATAEESILELANTMFHPKHRLRWHYRSKHEELIAFSNHYVYDSDLVIFPSPNASSDSMGVRLVRTNGTFHKKINPAEAQVMVEHIANFMRQHPKRSLGVVVMNQSQMEQIDSMMLRLAEQDTKVANYIDYWTAEDEGLQKFFVKNLENVQGDERDVIFIGTVYGADPDGRFYQRFGPINGPSGKRRLNVLFTRAKEEIVTFSSIPMEQFQPNANNEGASLLKLWLQFCATKRLGEVVIESGSGGTPDSPFEEHVISCIEAMGYTAVPQVGVSNYSIDIGVKHPDYPFGYLCGVECDGATYHSSKSARDRDRLRQEVLERLGWDLHRIWSTDWFRDPLGQSRKVKQYLDQLLARKLKDLPAEAKPVVEIEESPEPQQGSSAAIPKTDFSDTDIYVEEGSKVTLTYLDGARAGVTVKFWMTSPEDFNNDSISLTDHTKCPIFSPIAQALLDHKSGDIVSYNVQKTPVRVEIISVD